MFLIHSLRTFYSAFILPFSIFLALYLVVVSSLGITSGLSRAYVKLLMYLFEFCRRTIEKQERKARLRRLTSAENVSSDEEETKEHRTDRILDGSEKEDEDPDAVHEFHLADIYEFARKGIRAVADDDVTKRFSTEELRTWNLLTRTNKNYHIVSYKLMLLWSFGWIIRFCLLLPIRILIFVIGTLFLMITTSLVGFLPEGKGKRWLYERSSITAFRILARSVSSIIRFHDKVYKPRNGSLCVANHTSPLDAVILHTDTAYALVGQLHGGYLGAITSTLSRATSHCFFNRFEMNDRLAVVRKMREHITHPNKLPILIFPEGTCINNSAVMMFKKGSFEVADIVYPVAIKYDPIFGEAFWDSSKYGYFTYTMRMMTSWAIVCDVWYMKPMTREGNESSVDFASRVKKAIALKGGLVDLQWDGQLKRQKVKPEMKAKAQSEFSRKISVPF